MNRRNAFSLAELSIVLTIIALISGAILSGVSFYYQANLRSVIKEMRTINAAFTTFVDVYNSMPGDIKYPPVSWNAVAGNGDNIVTGGVESNNAWHHLYRAGLINQVFPSYTSGTDYNFYKSNYPQGIFEIRAIRAFLYQQNYKTGLKFGKQNSSTAGNAIFTPKDASYIDTKMDDGIASTGKLFGLDGDNSAGYSCSAWFNESSNGVVAGVPRNYNFAISYSSCRFNFWGDPEWSAQQ
ncbi:MAG: type II secretion system protein [Alphaproteobacteria bacterium]